MDPDTQRLWVRGYKSRHIKVKSKLSRNFLLIVILSDRSKRRTFVTKSYCARGIFLFFVTNNKRSLGFLYRFSFVVSLSLSFPSDSPSLSFPLRPVLSPSV